MTKYKTKKYLIKKFSYKSFQKRCHCGAYLRTIPIKKKIDEETFENFFVKICCETGKSPKKCFI